MGEGERTERERRVRPIENRLVQTEIGSDDVGDRMGPVAKPPRDIRRESTRGELTPSPMADDEPGGIRERPEDRLSLGAEAGDPLLGGAGLQGHVIDFDEATDPPPVVVAELLPGVPVPATDPDDEETAGH